MIIRITQPNQTMVEAKTHCYGCRQQDNNNNNSEEIEAYLKPKGFQPRPTVPPQDHISKQCCRFLFTLDMLINVQTGVNLYDMFVIKPSSKISKQSLYPSGHSLLDMSHVVSPGKIRAWSRLKPIVMVVDKKQDKTTRQKQGHT